MSNILKSISNLYKNLGDANKISGGKAQKSKRKSANKHIRGGAGTEGDTYSCMACHKISHADSASAAPAVSTVSASNLPAKTGGNDAISSEHIASKPLSSNSNDAIEVKQTGTLHDSSSQNGGGKVKSAKGAYKKYLNKFNLDILQKEAKRKGIKITVKKNGKISNIKKASLINKIAAKKFSK